VRQSDVVARLGGDEFVILFREVFNAEQVATVARKILSAVVKPLTIHAQECRVTASIGISVFPSDAEDEETLTKNADAAMYSVKEQGRNNFSFHSQEVKTQSSRALGALSGQPGRERPGCGSRARDEVYLGSRLPFRSCFCRRLFEMDLLVHISDPIDRDEMVPAAGFRIVLAQYDAIGGLQVVDGTNVLAVQAHNFHVLLNVQAFEHVSSPLIT
jgi:hypothetical protein